MDKPKNKYKYWIVFYNDEGNREDCSVFYSYLVKAKTKKGAIKITAKMCDEKPSRLDAVEQKVITSKNYQDYQSD